MAIGSVPVVLGSLWVTARQRSRGQLLAVLLPVEAALHLVFHAMSGPASVHLPRHGHLLVPGPDQAGLAHQTALHSAHLSGAHLSGAHLSATHLSSGWVPSPGMLACHLVAALATVWLLGYGEDALWAVAHQLLLRLVPMPLAGPCGCRPHTGYTSPVRCRRPTLTVASPRGPPVAIAG